MSSELYFSTVNRSEMPFQVFVGPRGVGKTYSSMAELVVDVDTRKPKYPETQIHGKFMYMRRMSREIEISTSDTANPFKKINADFGLDIVPKYSSKEKFATFTSLYKETMERIPVGYGAALVNFHSLRGVDFSDVDDIILDEAVGEKIARKNKAEGDAFLNMYETINRNREFDGFPPVTVKLLSNSISLNSEIFLALGIVPTMAAMIVRGQKRCTIKERGIYIEYASKEIFRQAKKDTALYRLAKGTRFSDEALDNQFTNDDFTHVKKVPLNEYKPIINFTNDYTVYAHKNNMSILHICRTHQRAPMQITHSQTEKLKLMLSGVYQQALITDRITFDDYSTQLVFDAFLL